MGFWGGLGRVLDIQEGGLRKYGAGGGLRGSHGAGGGVLGPKWGQRGSWGEWGGAEDPLTSPVLCPPPPPFQPR